MKRLKFQNKMCIQCRDLRGTVLTEGEHVGY